MKFPYKILFNQNLYESVVRGLLEESDEDLSSINELEDMGEDDTYFPTNLQPFC
jgi:hypothetical protein